MVFEFSDKRISVGVMIVRRAQKMTIGTNVLSLISSEKLLEQLHEPLSKVYRGRDVEDVLGFKRLLAGHVL